MKTILLLITTILISINSSSKSQSYQMIEGKNWRYRDMLLFNLIFNEGKNPNNNYHLPLRDFDSPSPSTAVAEEKELFNYNWYCDIDHNYFIFNPSIPNKPDDNPAVLNSKGGNLMISHGCNSSFPNQLNRQIDIGEGIVLIINNNSEMRMNAGSIINIHSGGQLIVAEGAELNMFDNAKINVYQGGHLSVDITATINTTTANNIITFHSGSKDCNIYKNLKNMEGTHPGSIVEVGPGQIFYDCADVYCGDILPRAFGDIVWDGVNYIIDTALIIEPNSSLTIKNGSHIQFGPAGSILVSLKGKLVVENSKLTGIQSCNGSWPGVMVTGDVVFDQSINPTNQHANYQGIVYLDNAEIHDAKIGIKCRQTQAVLNPNTTYTIKDVGGGILKAINSDFYNCETSVMMYPYEIKGTATENASQLDLCNFYFNESYPATLSKTKRCFIDLNGINKLEIYGCTFENTVAPTSSSDNLSLGTGIRSKNSAFRFTSYSFSGNPVIPYFKNLKFGIFAENSNSSATFSVTKTNFIDNLRGIDATNIDGLTITANNFYVGNQYYFKYGQTGVFLNNCKSGYKVEGNHFTTNYSYPNYGVDRKIGVVVDNSGPENNFIYRNNFDSLSHPFISQGDNRDPYSDEFGLQVRCNNFSNYERALNVEKVYINDQGIAQNQGFYNSPSGTQYQNLVFQFTNNSFIPGNSQFIDIYNSTGRSFKYNYYGYQSNPPTVVTNNVYLRPNNSYTHLFQTKCPSTLSGGNNNTSLFASYQANKYRAITAKQILDELVDGGETENLLWDIETSTPGEAYDLMLDLMSRSPYLSDEVLIETARNENVLTPAMITQVMVANPQSAKIDEVWEALYNRSTPFPAYLLNAIALNVTITSSKEMMENAIAYYYSEKQWAFDELLRNYREEGDGATTSSNIINLCTIDSSFFAENIVISDMLRRADFDGALSRLADISNWITLEEGEQMQYEDLSEFVDLYIDIAQYEGEDEIASETQLDQLQSIASDNEHFMQSSALTLLCWINGVDTIGQVIITEGQQPRLPKPSHDQNAINPLIHCFPNPASDYITVEYILPFVSTNDLYLVITSTDGKTLKTIKLGFASYQQIVDVRDLPDGVYVCSVNQGAKVLQSTTFSKFK